MTDENDPAAGSQPYATFVLELLLDRHRNVRRTRVTHVQRGAHETWAGWDERSLLGFMATRLGGPEGTIQPGPGAGRHWGPPRAAPASGVALEVVVEELSIDGVRPGDLVERPAGTTVRGQARFGVVGAEAGQVSISRAPFALHLLACELASGRTALLASFRQRLCPQVLDYVVIVELTLPEMGRSRLQILVVLSEADVVGVALGPVVAMSRTPGEADG